jgi:hypothetical protein
MGQEVGRLDRLDGVLDRALIVLFVALKVGAKLIGVLPTARAFGLATRDANYTTLLMSTGLTFGSATELLRHRFRAQIDKGLSIDHRPRIPTADNRGKFLSRVLRTLAFFRASTQPIGTLERQ